MALLHPFSGTEAKAKQPINQDLTDLKYKENIEDLANQIDSISGGGGGAVDTGVVGEIILGCETNEGKYWLRRFSPFQHMLNSDTDNPSGFDPENKDLGNQLLTFLESSNFNFAGASGTDIYSTNQLNQEKNGKLSFKIKKGVNFFGFTCYQSTATADSVSVFIDGQTPSSLGLTDVNGNPAPNTINTSSATTLNQTPFLFFGLDGQEHVISYVNTDSASKIFVWDSVLIGFRTQDPALDTKLKLKAGKAVVRGTEVDIEEQDISFDIETKNGRTDAIVSNDSGTVTVLKGESPAMTQAKPEEDIEFSSGPVTSLDVKNSFYFPDNGIVLVSTPFGGHFLASYNAKTDTLIQSHSLNGMVWETQPNENINPCTGFNGGVGEAVGDVNINYWGTAPIEITSLNNKIDFEITIAGLTTQHTATVSEGRYAADLVTIEKAINTAMQAVKPINGEYRATYNEKSQLWALFVEDIEVTRIDYLFSSGVNNSNSIASTLGFTGDQATKKSYTAVNEKQHKSVRVLLKDPVYMYPEDPRIKYTFVSSTVDTLDGLEDLENRLNLGFLRYANSDGELINISVDKDCCGLEINFAKFINAKSITVQIDNNEMIYLNQISNHYSNSFFITRGDITTAFISFPRGSRTITIRPETSAQFRYGDPADYFAFAGARQYFTKPSFEKLTRTQAILKDFSISPVSLYASIYSHNSGVLYSPNNGAGPATDDHINSIVETGSWSGTTGGSATEVFNGVRRQTSANGAYVDVNFTINGDGGGIYVKGHITSGWNTKASCFISTAAINESTDRVGNVHPTWASSLHDRNYLGIIGLPAGTYNFRVKSEDSVFLALQGFVVIDTLPPQENADTVSDINNTGQSVSYPVNVVRESILQDSGDRVPEWLDRSSYKEGISSLALYSANSPTWNNYDDGIYVNYNGDSWFSSYFEDAVADASFLFAGLCKSIAPQFAAFTNNTILNQDFIDGIQNANNYSQRVQVKGGASPSSLRFSASRLSSKIFNLPCTQNAGLVYDIANTRGIKNGVKLLLDDGTSTELVKVVSFVTDTSITIEQAPTVVVPANVTRAKFYGFHAYKVVQNDSNNTRISCFEYEPLDVTPSRILKYISTEFKYEKVSSTFKRVANNDDLTYPVHSDGVVGNYGTTTIEVIGWSTNNTFRLTNNLKSVQVSAGTVDIKLTSERLVPVNKEIL